jgi:hypothetical protein
MVIHRTGRDWHWMLAKKNIIENRDVLAYLKKNCWSGCKWKEQPNPLKKSNEKADIATGLYYVAV